MPLWPARAVPGGPCPSQLLRPAVPELQDHLPTLRRPLLLHLRGRQRQQPGLPGGHPQLCGGARAGGRAALVPSLGVLGTPLFSPQSGGSGRRRRHEVFPAPPRCVLCSGLSLFLGFFLTFFRRRFPMPLVAGAVCLPPCLSLSNSVFLAQVLNEYFHNVCELDLVFNFYKVGPGRGAGSWWQEGGPEPYSCPSASADAWSLAVRRQSAPQVLRFRSAFWGLAPGSPLDLPSLRFTRSWTRCSWPVRSVRPARRRCSNSC